jgi:hypothetical protein
MLQVNLQKQIGTKNQILSFLKRERDFRPLIMFMHEPLNVLERLHERFFVPFHVHLQIKTSEKLVVFKRGTYGGKLSRYAQVHNLLLKVLFKHD